MKVFLNILIFLLQSAGVLLVWVGLEMIWAPLGWIYAGVVAFVFGHLVYLEMESEEDEK